MGKRTETANTSHINHQPSTINHFFPIFCLFFFATNLAQAQWTTLTSNTTEDLHALYFMNKTVGFAVGNNGTVVKTVKRNFME